MIRSVCSTPPVLHVLRKVSEAHNGGPETWQFVGDLMNGEANEMDYEERVFVLV